MLTIPLHYQLQKSSTKINGGAHHGNPTNTNKKDQAKNNVHVKSNIPHRHNF